MYPSNVRSAGHRGLVFACALMIPAAVLAQAPTPATTLTQKEVEEIVVTGTRLPEPNLVAPSPTQVVDAEAIAISGKADISDLLATMPQVFQNSLGQDLGNTTSGLTTAGGVSTVDLRGLGPQRTLVLVNGKRLGIGSPNTAIASPAPNIDQIPTPLIERVDVLTGGASAVYGSDAIAGVVNFIMKKNFEGFQVDASYGFNWDENNYDAVHQQASDFSVDPLTGKTTDGEKGDISIIGGANTDDGRGNFTVFLGYHAQNPVPASHRDFGQCQFNKGFDDSGTPSNPHDDTSFAFCSGSANSNLWEPSNATGTGNNADFGVFGNTFVPWGSLDTPTSFGTNPATVFNAQPYIYMSRDDQRYTADFMGHYDFSESVKPYVEFSYMNDKTHQQIAPSALFFNGNVLTATGNYLINCSNPLLSQQQKDTLCSAADQLADATTPGSRLIDVAIGRRNVEGVGRFSDYEHNNYRAVAGVTGDFATAWSYDLYGQYYYVDFFNSNGGYLDLQKITNALQVTSVGGVPTCLTAVNGTDPTCVPYNIFAGDGVLQTDVTAGVTQESLDYMYSVGTAYGTDNLGTIHLDFTGQLGEYGIKLPTANDGVSVNVGYENRREHQTFQPDAAETAGLLSGFGGAQVPIDSSIRVKEYSAEVRVPLVQEKSFVQDLNVDFAYRYSDYSTQVGGVDTWAAQLQYAPVAGLRFRGSYNKAIRAPSIIELFNPQVVGKVQAGADPCAPTTATGGGTVAAAASLTACLNSVAPEDVAAFTAAYGNGGTTNTIPQGTAGQLSQLQGGNPNLDPEEADTYTVGLVVSPELLPNFRGSVDYWLIKGTKFIGAAAAPNLLLSRCIGNLQTGAGSDPGSCTQIVRQFTTFTLDGASVESGGYILQTNVNVAKVEVGGIDVQADYLLEMSPSLGSLDFAIYGSYMLKNETQSSPDVAPYDCTGLFGALCQTVNSDWRHTFMTTWKTPWDVDATFTWRFIDTVNQDQNNGSEFSDPRYPTYGSYDTFNAHIASQSYFDLAAFYHALDGKLELRAGINNILDNRPPVVTTEIVSGGQANTYETYDLFGRQVFMGFTMKL